MLLITTQIFSKLYEKMKLLLSLFQIGLI